MLLTYRYFPISIHYYGTNSTLLRLYTTTTTSACFSDILDVTFANYLPISCIFIVSLHLLLFLTCILLAGYTNGNIKFINDKVIAIPRCARARHEDIRLIVKFRRGNYYLRSVRQRVKTVLHL